MDIKYIVAKNISNLRVLNNMTQAELGEKLNYSDKTISKWECGGGFPDTSLMLPLCKELDITANELLSGKKLKDNDEYVESAEYNLVELNKKNERNSKFLLSIEILLGYISSVLLFVLVLVASFCSLSTVARILIIVFGFLQFIVGVHFCLVIEKDAGYYECRHCHNKYIPEYKQVLFSMHYGRTRYMKCPKCNKRSWQKKVLK